MLFRSSFAFFFGPDEGYDQDVGPGVQAALDRTIAYWRDWVRKLYLPLDWQEAVIRAAITLKLCAYEETGAIVAAMTTSVPEFPESGRNWDYRYCRSEERRVGKECRSRWSADH